MGLVKWNNSFQLTFEFQKFFSKELPQFEFTKLRFCVRNWHLPGGRNCLGEQQEEHGQGDEYWNRERHFLTAVTGQIEDQHSEKRDARTGQYQVHGVEERLATHADVEGEIQIGRFAAQVELRISSGRHFH